MNLVEKAYLFLVLLFVSLVEVNAQNKDWLIVSERLFPNVPQSGQVELTGMKVDPKGNIIISGRGNCGSRYNNVVIDGNNSNCDQNTSFIMKINTDGHTVWTRTLTKNKGHFTFIETDNEDNYYIRGYFDNAYIDNYNILLNGDYLVKINKNGKIIWAQKIPTYGNERLGFGRMKVDINKNITALQTLPVGSKACNIISKLDSLGNLQVIHLDTSTFANWQQHEVDTKQNLYAFGRDNYNKKSAIRKYDKNGNLLKEKIFYDKDYGTGHLQITALKIDQKGGVYISGVFRLAGKDRIYLLKLDEGFNDVWEYKGPESIGGWCIITVDPQTQSICLTADVNGIVDFGNSFKADLTNNGLAYVKFDQMGKPFWLKVSSSRVSVAFDQFLDFQEDGCGKTYIRITAFDSLYIEGKLISTDWASVIKKYNSDGTDSISFKTEGNCGTIKLNSHAHNSFKNIYWFVDGKKIDSNKSSIVLAFPKSGKYTITLLGVKDNGSCRSNFSDTITFFKQPEAKFTHKDTVGCQWVGYQFINQSTADTIHPIERESYLWDFGDGTTDTAKDPLHIFTKSGKFKVSLIYSNGFCSDTFTQEQTVEILAAPKPGFTVNDTVGCAPFTVNVKDNSAGEVAKYTYSFGKENESNDANPDYTFTKPGIYYITQKLLGATGCITTDSVRLRIRSGIVANEKPEMLRATFVNNVTVGISWRKHALAQYYTLYRQTGNNAPQTIQKHFSDTVYMDQVVSLDKPLRYYIQATDSCGNVSAQSSIAQPVILHGENKENTIFLLTYTAYEQWQNGVKEYILQYRAAEDSFISIANAVSLSQTDSFRAQSKNGTQCYRIIAMEMDGNKQVSYSNTVCLPHVPQVYVPNAFSPNNDAVNDFFSISAIGITESNISIYNRWGEKVYQNTQGETINWDGKFKSAPVPDDVYIYTLQLRTIHGEKIYRTGNIYLTR